MCLRFKFLHPSKGLCSKFSLKKSNSLYPNGEWTPWPASLSPWKYLFVYVFWFILFSLEKKKVNKSLLSA
jgi:hypothetical protein